MIGIFGAIGWHTIAKTDSGTMDMVINGAGYDLALAFAALQVQTSFASCVSEGKTSELMRMDLAEHGLVDLLLREPELPFTGSVAWYEHGHERIMRAHPAFNATYPETYLDNLIKKSDLLVCELGFTVNTLDVLNTLAVEKGIPILWIARSKSDWQKIEDHPAWQVHNLFASPHAYEDWSNHINKMPGLEKTGFATITTSANMLMVWQDDAHAMLPIAAETPHPEYRFSNVVASIVNEMTAWGVPLYDAANNCSGTFQDWVDLQDTGGADLERKVATFYKKVENLEHDALTGLLSRGAAEKILASKQLDLPLSMILVDVDHFKRVNDTLGHHIGDEVLRAVAHKIARETRDKDVAVRWGGEEFVILLPGCPESRAVSIAERIRLAMHQVRTELGHVTASFGVAERLSEPNLEPLDAWFVRVDTRLYTAKKTGRDQVVHSDSPHP